MGLLDTLFGRSRSSAPVARDRLQILLAHERAGTDGQESELLNTLHSEILEVIKRHIPVDQDKVQIKVDRGTSVSMLEIDIEVPALEKKKLREVR
ncbi:cell division topological specificity factor MinE [Novacetimonas hansenii]|uniref:Cell division topological specificity factor n=2 Tax=Novacetimonas hansenii TaxID=436 RepID=A0AAW5EP90_NOVHA|nr:cell division topological specificity factor MinE [Novacetimonas hansenii]EFG85263.1 cell division topological specificity factor MinE [Novacetimonas hansenii ATCC 23769]MCJ8352601.1 cell division topological specificity factor MinE [Novacetimonas hansenii]PYD72440.1 cell division topological specificity factor MinE [Novacetimonas hansenii]QOF94787.1 cell division topological specificity factor MinE [Novacetimonas hansenii]RFP01517.1 cell division topological specificity factor MinE [Novace